MSVVIDVNVLISAFIFPSSKPALAVKKAFTNGTVNVSLEIIEELRYKILSDKFDKYAPFTIRALFIKEFEKRSEIKEVKTQVKFCRDPKDDKYLSIAKAAKADTIITGDKDLLVLHPFESISIITPAEFLKL